MARFDDIEVIDRATLIEWLEIAVRSYDPRSDIGDQSKLKALIATIYYLQWVVKIPDRLLVPLFSLSDDLMDLISGKAGKPSRQGAVDADTAATVDLLRRAGCACTIDEACRIVARATGGRMSKNQVYELRRNIKKGRAHPNVCSRYSWVLASVDEYFKFFEKSEPLPDDVRPIIETLFRDHNKARARVFLKQVREHWQPQKG